VLSYLINLCLKFLGDKYQHGSITFFFKLNGILYLSTGKSSKMSEGGLLLGEKCPQNCVEEILQNQQLYLIWPHFQP
jgi:hypothetical protein